MKGTVEKNKNGIYRSMMTALLCADGFLLIIYHIANGETNIVSAGFEKLYITIPILTIIFGLVQSIKEYSFPGWLRRNWLVLLYITLRLASCISNDLTSDPGFWLSISYEIMFLIAINNVTAKSITIRIFICSLIAFDLIAISICSYHFFFLKDLMTSAAGSYQALVRAGLPFTMIFTNQNPAGMLAGLTASACILQLGTSSKSLKLLLSAIIAINVMFLLWSRSLTAFVGIVLILAISIARAYLKTINYKAVISSALVLCVAVMIPVYVITLSSNQETKLQNSTEEILLNSLSSGRYNIWKEHILSQEGHYLLGFGTSSKAVGARTEYIKNSNADETIQVDETHQAMETRTDLGFHNGYLELVVTAGVPAAILVFIILYYFICSL